MAVSSISGAPYLLNWGLDLCNPPDQTLLRLKDSAQGGGRDAVDAIELLINHALRKDEIGGQAEQILFSLFLGPDPEREILGKQLVKALEYLLKAQQSSFQPDDQTTPSLLNGMLEKLTRPTLLSVLAGQAAHEASLEGGSAESDLEQLAQAAWQLNVNRHSNPETILINSLGPNPWCQGRFVTDDELTAYFNTSSCAHVMVGSPVSLEHHEVKQIIADQLQDIATHPLAVPLLDGEHWKLLVCYREQQQLHALLFDSKAVPIGVVDQRLQDIIPTAKIDHVGGALQEYVPNGCGLFVADAIRYLDTSLGGGKTDLKQILNQYSDNFLSKDISEQVAFNRQQRLQMINALM